MTSWLFYILILTGVMCLWRPEGCLIFPSAILRSVWETWAASEIAVTWDVVCSNFLFSSRPFVAPTCDSTNAEILWEVCVENLTHWLSSVQTQIESKVLKLWRAHTAAGGLLCWDRRSVWMCGSESRYPRCPDIKLRTSTHTCTLLAALVLIYIDLWLWRASH